MPARPAAACAQGQSARRGRPRQDGWAPDARQPAPCPQPAPISWPKPCGPSEAPRRSCDSPPTWSRARSGDQGRRAGDQEHKDGPDQAPEPAPPRRARPILRQALHQRASVRAAPTGGGSPHARGPRRATAPGRRGRRMFVRMTSMPDRCRQEKAASRRFPSGGKPAPARPAGRAAPARPARSSPRSPDLAAPAVPPRAEKPTTIAPGRRIGPRWDRSR